MTSPGPDRRRPPSGSRVSFLISLALHVAVILLLGIGGVQKAKDEIKLTEISYIEERYGEEVAKKVTVAPEKLAAMVPEDEPEPLREGSIFAKEDKTPPPPPVMAAQMASVPLPAPKPRPVAAPNPFAEAELKSRSRSRPGISAPRVEAEDVLLSAGLTDSPRSVRQTSEEVNLDGEVLVGRQSRLDEAALFEVEAGDGPSIAGAALTLTVPEGGIAEGHPDLVGGSLADGKRAYRGDLPSGHLVATDAGRDRITALASIQTTGPGEGAGILGGEVAEPSHGKGLVSRGGRDAISRGSLGPRGNGASRPAEALTRAIAPPKPAENETEAAPAQRSAAEEKGVSMTLSGPILGREVLASRPPEYPIEAKQQGWQGSVSVYFTVKADGSIKKVFVEKASPYQVLDQAAKRCLDSWRFSPEPDAAEQWGVLTIVFRLH